MTPQTAYVGTAFVGLGSSLPWLGQSPADVVRGAARALGRLGPVRLSPLYDSPAWPDPGRPPYVNAVALVRAALPPEALLAACQAIEAAYGRRRDPGDRNAPRTLDLDLLAVGAERRDTPTLILPHPRMAERDFVLAPLARLAPDWRHPVSGRTATQMRAAVAGGATERL